MPLNAPPELPNTAEPGTGMTGRELKMVRKVLGDTIGDRLSCLDMAMLIGLANPERNGKDTYRKWEDGPGPSGPVQSYLNLIMDGLLDSDDVREFMIRKIKTAIGFIDR